MVRRLMVSMVAASLAGLVVTGCGGEEPFDEEAARAEVEANWEDFFDASQPVESKADLLQHGELLQEILQTSAENNTGIDQLRAEVTEVTIGEDHDSAEVVFDLFNADVKLLGEVQGTAVLDEGTWKVGASLFCDLQSLANNFCPELPED